LLIGVGPLFGQGDEKIVSLSKKIIEAKSNDEAGEPFKELKDLYFKDSKYSEFVDLLKSLGAKKKSLEPYVGYYIGLCRYQQLKSLEEKKAWEEYFSQANAYKEELSRELQRAVAATKDVPSSISVYIRLLLWQFYKDNQFAQTDEALGDLMTVVREFANTQADSMPIKEAAEVLAAYSERSKSQELYKLYVTKLVNSNIKDEELRETALGFKKEGSLELAESLFDAYMERLKGLAEKEKAVATLVEIARSFAYLSCKGLNIDEKKDPLYAEKVFQKIEELSGKEKFDEELLYQRAFNLEKAKVYLKAADLYKQLNDSFPKGVHLDEADFKMGIIFTYISRDIKTGREYFTKLSEREVLSPQVISSLYQLGLLAQWEEDMPKAKEFYSRLLEKAKDGFVETTALSKERLKEIEESKPIEYNLKTFLDVSLKEARVSYDMSRLNLYALPYQLNPEKEDNIFSNVILPESGCMQLEVDYLWSGHLGAWRPALEEHSFNTKFASVGTKEINLVVVSPTGIIDCDIYLVDVY
jgi:TolA-binding protein